MSAIMVMVEIWRSTSRARAQLRILRTTALLLWKRRMHHRLTWILRTKYLTPTPRSFIKAPNTVKSQLTSSSRDTSGELIKSGTSYVVYIMSVSTNTSTDSKLSSASSSLTLSVNTASAPVITQVRDISDYGDGRDIQVSFNRSSDESKVANYRVFVVRNTVASDFNLTTASNLSSSLYYTVNKTGNNITVNLPSNMRDTSGYNVTNLQDYRIFVMAKRYAKRTTTPMRCQLLRVCWDWLLTALQVWRAICLLPISRTMGTDLTCVSRLPKRQMNPVFLTIACL